MDPRQAIIEDLDPSPSRIEFSSKPIVLLCGGGVPERARPDEDKPPFKSIRHRIVDRFPSYEIFRPEEIDDWHADGIFENLMDFESDLASICSLVVIILESEGAIAELGAFSQLPDFKRKLCIVIPETYADDNSFINLGILRYISKEDESAIKRYPWDVRRPIEASEEVIIDIIEDIEADLGKQQKSQSLKMSSEAHLMIVIYELTRLFVALRESEIIEVISKLGHEIKKENLRRKLFLLQRLRLIKKITYSDSKFFAATNPFFSQCALCIEIQDSIQSCKNSIR